MDMYSEIGTFFTPKYVNLLSKNQRNSQAFEEVLQVLAEYHLDKIQNMLQNGTYDLDILTSSYFIAVNTALSWIKYSGYSRESIQVFCDIIWLIETMNTPVHVHAITQWLNDKDRENLATKIFEIAKANEWLQYYFVSTFVDVLHSLRLGVTKEVQTAYLFRLCGTIYNYERNFKRAFYYLDSIYQREYWKSLDNDSLVAYAKMYGYSAVKTNHIDIIRNFGTIFNGGNSSLNLYAFYDDLADQFVGVKDDRDEAVQVYMLGLLMHNEKAVIDMDQPHYKVIYDIGREYERIHNIEHAFRCYNNVIRLNSEYCDVYPKYMNLLIKDEKYSDVIELFETAVDLLVNCSNNIMIQIWKLMSKTYQSISDYNSKEYFDTKVEDGIYLELNNKLNIDTKQLIHTMSNITIELDPNYSVLKYIIKIQYQSSNISNTTNTYQFTKYDFQFSDFISYLDHVSFQSTNIEPHIEQITSVYNAQTPMPSDTKIPHLTTFLISLFTIAKENINIAVELIYFLTDNSLMNLDDSLIF